MGKFGYRCSDQGLKTLDDSKLVDYIQELECDNNPDLDAISTAIGKCKNLETLMANNCSISAIPVELCAASSSLTSVNLSFNQIAEVPPGLAALTALVDIDLSSNLLATVPDAVLAGWASIEFLYLSDNKLTTVGSVAPCHKLYELRLNGNQLTALPTLGDEYAEFALLDASGNPRLNATPDAYTEKYPSLKITW